MISDRQIEIHSRDAAIGKTDEVRITRS